MKKNYVLLSLTAIIGLLPLGLMGQKITKNHKAVLAHVEDLVPEIDRMAMKLWDFSEIALRETESAKLLIDVLQKEGFSIEEGVAGMPTAFVATYQSADPKPVIGVLAEFDALPGVGNQKVPEKIARKDGVSSGHGCGHNLFGSASVAGAIALKRTMEERGMPGTVKLFGTPAEETVVGKVYMAKEGIFDGLDACIEWHPGTQTGAITKPGKAMNNFEVEFFGQSAHSAGDPWNGRSALDAVEMMNFGVNLMREHVKPTSRIHYVIKDGGMAPNVVPDYAKVWYYVRDMDREHVETNYERILNIAKGAALGTNTTHKVTLITGVHERLLLRPLIERMNAHLEFIGAPTYTEEEQTWGKALQRFCGKEEKGWDDAVQTLPPVDAPIDRSGGSTDVAEVSYITPTVGFRVTTAPYGVPWHSWATSSAHGTPAGVKGAVVAAKAIGLMGYDLLTDADLRAEAKALFDKLTEGKPYKSPIPQDQQVILPVGED